MVCRDPCEYVDTGDECQNCILTVSSKVKLEAKDPERLIMYLNYKFPDKDYSLEKDGEDLWAVNKNELDREQIVKMQDGSNLYFVNITDYEVINIHGWKYLHELEYQRWLNQE